ncbi:hypothetical protein ABEB36_008527 [Hypothenemus hampei]|uniref:Lipocalin/cytosolic fatty-acid binding domain-containing protein n=1 Tax=Hypothenemus hampei TaxID=57062 RepID=A0ABD1EM72_HYPHA
MVEFEGTYLHEHSENLDEYFKALGVPYIPRKIICATNPTIEISKISDNKWSITSKTMIKTSVSTFALGEEYEEHMQGGALKCVTTMENNDLVSQCIGPGNTEMTRIYSFTDDGLIITYILKEAEIKAKRHFKRQQIA